MTTSKLYEARGNVVHKLPVKVRNDTDTGNVFEVGFPVCTASEYVEAAMLAAILEHAAPPPDRSDMLRKIESVLSIPSSGHASASELAETILDAIGITEVDTVTQP